MNGRRYGQPLRPDINIFNFHSLLAALTCLVVWLTCRGRKNYKPCVFSYMACSFTFHRDSFSPKRAYGHEKRRFLPPFPLFLYKDNTFSGQKQIVLKSQMRHKTEIRPRGKAVPRSATAQAVDRSAENKERRTCEYGITIVILQIPQRGRETGTFAPFPKQA